MLTQHYSAGQRRGLNQIWSGAGEYGFEPLFLAMDGQGVPDLYMNCVAGCVRKWYGEEIPRKLFETWAGDRRQELLDALSWLVLESAVYQRELPERPVLAELRRAHAQAFFDQEYHLSRQEWMAKNQRTYTQEAARWRKVLGRRPPVMTPGEKRLAAALDPGWVEPEALAATVLAAFGAARLFDGRRREITPLRFRLKGRWAGVMIRLMPTEIHHTDVVTVGSALPGGNGSGERAVDPRRAVMRLRENAETDREYIESCFGPALFSPQETAMLERELCTGNHFGCRLWFTAGRPDPELARRRETRYLIEQTALQCKRNREAFNKDAALYQNAILRLTEQVRACLQVHSQAETEPARRGRLDSQRVWRAAVLRDPRVFLREEASPRPGFSVDLLLDASASRLHCQETVSAQGYILAECLSRCGVAVRVSAFCSLRGYTVLRVLKPFGERRGQGVFRYFASGWNRDGLALRAAGALLQSAPEGERLLILLTDASPNDSRRLPPGGKYPLGHDYADAPAVEDAAREVQALRNQGVRVSAVYMGGNAGVDAARRIYGRSLARIRSMDQLADAAGRLIQEEIQALSQ